MNVNVTPLPTPPQAPAEPKRRTITLTHRAPIQIIEDEWPIIAEGKCGWEHPSQDGTGWDFAIRVRRGKYSYIVHANYNLSTHDGEDDQQTRVGRVVHESEAMMRLNAHVLEVGEELRSRVENVKLAKYVTHMLDNCFASMKPTTY